MTKTFTEQDLIRYLYLETTEEEEKEISNALICDSELLALFNELVAFQKQLDTSKLEPSEKTVSAILSYARALPAKE